MRKPRNVADDSVILASCVHAGQGSRSLDTLRGAPHGAPTRTPGRIVRYVPTVAVGWSAGTADHPSPCGDRVRGVHRIGAER